MMTVIARLRRTFERGQRGQMLIVFALVIVPVSLVIGVVAVDASMWQSERRGAQKDADLSALAGAYELLAPVADVAAAKTQTASYAATNDESGNASIVGKNGEDPGDIVVDNSCFNGPRPDSVALNINHKSRLFFGDAFGIPLPKPGAHARACAGSVVEMKGLMPVGLPICTDLDPKTCPNSRSLCWSPDIDGDGLPEPLYGKQCDLSVFDKVSGEASWLDLDGSSPLPNPPTLGCYKGGGGANELADEIKAGGANTWCHIAPEGYTAAQCAGASIPPVNWCVKSKTGGQADKVMKAFNSLFSTEGKCDSDGDKIDDFGGAMELESGTAGTASARYREICHSPRLITLIVVDHFDPTGNDFMPIRAFASFFVEACAVDGVAFPKCDPRGDIGHATFTGRFVNILADGEIGALTNWSPKRVLLDQ